VRSYLTITKDLGRVMSRVKAIYRSLGHSLYRQAGVCTAPSCRVAREDRRTGSAPRAEFLLPTTRCAADGASRSAAGAVGGGQETPGLETALQIPSIGPIRSAVLLGILQTPHRFRTKRQLWTYSGFGIETQSSADHRSVNGQLERVKKQSSIRGLNRNCNHDLKNLFKGAAIVASSKPGPFQEFYTALLTKGIRPEMARLTLARKIATIALIVWKRGACFDAQHLKPQTA